MEAWFYIAVAAAAGVSGWMLRGLARDARYAQLWREYELLAGRYAELYRGFARDGRLDPHERIKRVWGSENTELLDKFTNSKFGRRNGVS